MTQTELAHKLKVVPSTVTQWESGVRNPSLVMIKKTAKILNCTVDDLLRPIKV